MNTFLLTLAILPALLLGVYVYRQDKQQKEPLGMLIKAFFYGALSIFPAVLLEVVLSAFDPNMPVVSGIYKGYVVAGFSEELSKLLLLAWAVWKSPHFDEYFDGIVYATFVSLGFASIENIQYVFLSGTFAEAVSTGVMRAVLSVPGHFLFGVSMGYFFALAKFESSRRTLHFFNALLIPMLLHGTYDALLMIPESMGSNGTLTSVLFVVFIWFDIRLWKIGRRRLSHLQQLSSQQAQPKDNGLDHLNWDV